MEVVQLVNFIECFHNIGKLKIGFMQLYLIGDLLLLLFPIVHFGFPYYVSQMGKAKYSNITKDVLKYESSAYKNSVGVCKVEILISPPIFPSIISSSYLVILMMFM